MSPTSLTLAQCQSRPRLSLQNTELAETLLRLTPATKRWAFRLCFLYLRNVKHRTWKHKRVHRTYRELELTLHIKPALR